MAVVGEHQIAQRCYRGDNLKVRRMACVAAARSETQEKEEFEMSEGRWVC